MSSRGRVRKKKVLDLEESGVRTAARGRGRVYRLASLEAL